MRRGNKPIDRHYFELCEKIGKLEYGSREAHDIHRQLKEYGSGIPIYMRYPNLPTYISVVTLFASVIILIMKSKGLI